jgi:beta-N-acetylhexosaminidase
MSSLQALALRCILPGFDGTTAPDWVRRRAAEGLGGVVLFGRNVDTPDQLRRLVESLHAERSEIVVAIDEEGGEVTRLEAKTGSSYPGNLALGYAGDVRLTREVAAAIGAELAAVGIDLNLAPVADVNTDPRNPIIGARSFGSDASAVAAHTAAWVQGLQSAGVAACAKHFPGHGDTSVDSHLALPVAGEDPHARALEPFRAAIAAGARAIMSAHIVVPALDQAPATISARIMTDMLRDELGFGGLAVSDGLEMRGLAGDHGVAEAAVLALAAGCDALVVGGGLSDEQIVLDITNAVARAVEDGRLSEPRLAEAASRLDRVKVVGETLEVERGAGREAARRAICAEGDVHLESEASVVQMPSPSSIAAGDIPWGMTEALAGRGVRVTAKSGRLVIAVRDLHRQPDNQRTVDALLGRHPDAIVVEMGVPLHRPAQARAYIATHGSARVCAEAAAERMTAG